MHTFRRYDGLTIAFHWITAILVVEQWLGAQVIDDFPAGPPRIDARSVHITLGLVLAAVLVARLVWRNTGGRRLPAADTGWIAIIAKATHWGLYALLSAMLVVGILLTWSRGDSLYNLVSIPSFAPDDKALPDCIQAIHATIGYAILGLAGLHAAAALFHRFAWNDGVLGRMLPIGTRRTP